MLIVNADDFGYSPAVNAAIVRAFRDGLISSTTIMANGQAFDEACELAHRHGFAGRIGCHLVLTEGEPVTEEVKRFSRFCDAQGMFRFKRNRHPVFWPNEVRALRIEIAEQLNRCRERGLAITHVDGHHHCHAEPAVFHVLAPVLRSLKVPYLRLTDNVRPARLARRLYKRFFNATVRWAGFAGTDYFCDFQDLPRLDRVLRRDTAIVEVMVHPAISPDGALIDAESQLPLAGPLEIALQSSRLGSYADIGRVA